MNSATRHVMKMGEIRRHEGVVNYIAEVIREALDHHVGEVIENRETIISHILEELSHADDIYGLEFRRKSI